MGEREISCLHLRPFFGSWLSPGYVAMGVARIGPLVRGAAGRKMNIKITPPIYFGVITGVCVGLAVLAGYRLITLLR